jgi:hypothetical protein
VHIDARRDGEPLFEPNAIAQLRDGLRCELAAHRDVVFALVSIAWMQHAIGPVAIVGQ